MGEFIWIGILAYLLDGEPKYERRVVETEAECIAMNKAAVEIMKERTDIIAYGAACIRIDLTIKTEAPKPKAAPKKGQFTT